MRKILYNFLFLLIVLTANYGHAKTGWNPNEVAIEKIDVSEWEGSSKLAVVLHNILTPEECGILIRLSESNVYEQATINAGGKQVLLTDARNSYRSVVDDFMITEQLWQRVLTALTLKDPKLLSDVVNIPWINGRKKESGQQPFTAKFTAVGLNERMRFLRYDPGMFFDAHYDGSYIRSQEGGSDRAGEQSFVTLQLYLNEDFEGGATRFLSVDEMDEQDLLEVEGQLTAIEDEKRSRASTLFEDITRWLYGAKPASAKLLGHDVVPRTGSVLLFQHDCLHRGSLVRAGRKYTMRTDVMYSTRGAETGTSKAAVDEL